MLNHMYIDEGVGVERGIKEKGTTLVHVLIVEQPVKIRTLHVFPIFKLLIERNFVLNAAPSFKDLGWTWGTFLPPPFTLSAPLLRVGEMHETSYIIRNDCFLNSLYIYFLYQ